MSVSQVLQELARQAGQARLRRAEILGETISGLSQLPAQILSDRDHERRQAAIDAQARDTYQRRVAADNREQNAALAEQRKNAALDKAVAAGWGTSAQDFNVDRATASLVADGYPQAALNLAQQHKRKLVEYDPTKGLKDEATGEIVREPVAAPPAPPQMGTPAYEIYARQQALLTPSVAAPGAPPAPPPAGPVDRTTWDARADGSAKGDGFLGVLTRPDGKVSTEISVGVNLDGKEVEIPTLVPTLSVVERNWLLTHDVSDPTKIPPAILEKAVTFARTRQQQGKPFFAQPGEGPAASSSAPLTPNAAALQAYDEQRKATEAASHSPIYKEWQDYTKAGGKLDFNAYQTMDANRKRPLSITNAATDDKLVDEAAHNILANPRDLTSIKNITTLRGDQRLKLFNRLKELDPTFNVGNIDRQIKFIDSYENPAGKPAMNRQSMNNILMHASDLSDVNQEYRRTNVRLANTPLNTIKKQYSSDYERYAVTVAVLKDEIGLYFAGGYAPTKDQGDTWARILNDDVTPNQIEAFAKQLIHVGLRRASTHNSDFRSVMGYDDPNLLTPDAVAAGVHLGLGDAMKPFGSGGTLGGKPPASGAPKRIVYGMDGKPVK